MPTVFRQAGFPIVIYPDDHQPIHVHVKKAGSEVKINALTLELMSVKGAMSNKDIRRAVEMVAQEQPLIIEKWSELNGQN
ncbi:MAG: DUF4160 domain-containing protein [Phormidesmis sp.]